MAGLRRGARQVTVRTIEYGGLAALVTAAFGLAAAVGGGTVVAVVAVAATFEPAQRGLHRLANRLVYGHRRSPWRAVADLAARMGRERDPTVVLQELAAVVRAGTGAERVAVWLRVGGAWEPVAGSPTVPTGHLIDGDLVVEIRSGGELLGAIATSGSRPVTPLEARLVADLAAQVSGVTRTIRLRAVLARQLEVSREQRRHLAASRLRLVAAQDEARRSLERDIHDTCQQYALALSSRIGLSGVLAKSDPVAVHVAIDNAGADVNRLAVALRRLTLTVPVPELISDGLAAALRTETAAAPVPVEVVDERSDRWAADVEAAMFFCCVEAVQNSVKHAHASTIAVGLSTVDDKATAVVRDDGVGFDVRARVVGTGLANMRERLAAVGGVLTIRADHGGATVTMVAPTRLAEPS
jgi:signal transduction histidine kinase